MPAVIRNSRPIGAWRPRVRQATAVIGALAAAGLMWSNRHRLIGASLIPSAKSTETFWFCHACNAGFALTADEYTRNVAYVVPDAATNGAKHQVPHPRATVSCPKCGGPAVSARCCLCQPDGTIYDPRPPDGSDGKCPKCGASSDLSPT